MSHSVPAADRLTPSEADAAVRKCERFVWRMAHRFAARWRGTPRHAQELEHFHGAGLVGLAEAAARFEPSRGFTFLTLASWHVRRAMQVAARDRERLLGDCGVRSIDDERHDGFALALNLVDHRGREPKPRPVLNWWRVVKPLTQRQREVVLLIFREGRTPAEAAAELGLTRQGVALACKNALDRIRRYPTALRALEQLGGGNAA